MSVIAALEAITSPSLSQDDTGKRTWEREFIVKCSLLTDDPVVIKASGQLPAEGAGYSFEGHTDAQAVLTRYRFKRDPGIGANSIFVWRVTAEYNTDATDPEEDEGDNPLDWRPRFRQGVGLTRKVLHKAYTEGQEDRGVEVANPVGDPYVPGIEYDEPHVIWWIDRNETEHPDPGGEKVLSVNQSAFGAWPPGCVLLANIGASREFHKSFAYFKITYELHFKLREPRWGIEVKATGLRERDPGTGLIEKIIDRSTNTPITKPVYLTGQGASTNDAAVAEVKVYWPYPFIDWSALNLPNPFEPD